MKPVIGITSRKSSDEKGLYINEAYHESVVKNGGIPIILPMTDPDTFIQTLSICDGVLFSGGEDVDPKYYEEDPHAGLGKLNSARDACEFLGMQYVHQNDIPTFAICRGMQMMNVALGGTLYQDIHSNVKKTIQHNQKSARSMDIHFVEILEESMLFQILGNQKKVRVNSFHHQSIKEPANTLKVTAKSSDGVVEAVEDTTRTLFYGVQWHPEELTETIPVMNQLFKALVDTAKMKKIGSSIVRNVV